jgi:transposase
LEAQRRRYAELIAQGVSNSEACRVVGVNRRTGSRWRYGRRLPGPDGIDRQYAPMISDPEPVRSTRYLSDDERDVVVHRHRGGASLRAIARELERAPSTISREIHRNRHETGSYRPVFAHRLAAAHGARPRPRRVTTDVVLRQAVIGMLDCKWSPEQISHTLRRRFPDTPSRQLTHESVYQARYSLSETAGQDIGLPIARRSHMSIKASAATTAACDPRVVASARIPSSLRGNGCGPISSL